MFNKYQGIYDKHYGVCWVDGICFPIEAEDAEIERVLDEVSHICYPLTTLHSFKAVVKLLSLPQQIQAELMELPKKGVFILGDTKIKKITPSTYSLMYV